MNAALSQFVRGRAQNRCEYCRLAQAHSILLFEIDHIIARKHGGLTIEANLALACFYCNSAKGPNIAGIDPDNGRIVPLFHPRTDAWKEQFHWNGAILQGSTPSARATIAVLGINEPARIALRESLLREGIQLEI